MRARCETFRESDLAAVTEPGPCPLCGEETVKTDWGGTICVSCAIFCASHPTPEDDERRMRTLKLLRDDSDCAR